jgi:hypothetical protein
MALITTSISYAQSFPEKKIMNKLGARKIVMDQGNEDGVFRAQSRKTKKWGMYQWMYEGTDVKILIPMEYDSIRNFPFNGAFTAVYNDGKVGIYLCEWSYGDDARQTVECKYEDYRRVNVKQDEYRSQLYLAMKKDGKWGWVDWITGEEKSEFIYETTKDLPYPDYKQRSSW